MDKDSTTNFLILHPTYNITPTNYSVWMIIIQCVRSFSLHFGNAVVSWYGQIFTSSINASHGHIRHLFSMLTHMNLTHNQEPELGLNILFYHFLVMVDTYKSLDLSGDVLNLWGCNKLYRSLLMRGFIESKYKYCLLDIWIYSGSLK